MKTKLTDKVEKYKEKYKIVAKKYNILKMNNTQDPIDFNKIQEQLLEYRNELNRKNLYKDIESVIFKTQEIVEHNVLHFDEFKNVET